jgi:hypothetical protein
MPATLYGFRSWPEPVVTLAMCFVHVLALPAVVLRATRFS